MHAELDRRTTPFLPVGAAHDVRPVEKGRFRARLTDCPADVDAALALRARRFRNGSDDADALDDVCRHVIVEPIDGGNPIATFRFLHLADGRGIGLTYSAQFYDLTRLQAYCRPLIEIGRFCTDGEVSDADVLRIGWALLTRYVDAHEIGLMFGCSSFPGNDTAPYRDTLCLLALRHCAPKEWAPGMGSQDIVSFADILLGGAPNLRAANAAMPKLLRTYLAMGGWVSDHAVIDRELGTFHVFTGVEIDSIPPTRKRLLRADAA